MVFEDKRDNHEAWLLVSPMGVMLAHFGFLVFLSLGLLPGGSAGCSHRTPGDVRGRLTCGVECR